MKQKEHQVPPRVHGSAALADEDTAVLAAIRKITSKGNDAEVKRKADGKLHVYEIKRTSYP